MLNTIFATKVEMSQAWSEEGKRLPITKLKVDANIILSKQLTQDQKQTLEIGYGRKKLKNVAKSLRTKIAKSGFSFGVKQVQGVKVLGDEESTQEVGQNLLLNEILAVGDVVQVQGPSKGRGFAGAVKRYGFHGGPKTHGQSDRTRTVGSIGSGTTPGRIWKGKRMPGHYGAENKTVSGLVVVYLDQQNQEVWLNGPVPGCRNAIVRVSKTGEKRTIRLNKQLSNLTPKEDINSTEENKKA